jgi:hypothetical protein
MFGTGDWRWRDPCAPLFESREPANSKPNSKPKHEIRTLRVSEEIVCQFRIDSDILGLRFMPPLVDSLTMNAASGLPGSSGLAHGREN